MRWLSYFMPSLPDIFKMAVTVVLMHESRSEGDRCKILW